MKSVLLLTTILSLSAAPALAQTTEDLNNDGKNTDNVLTQSMGNRPQELQPARANQQIEHQAARAGLEHEPDERHRRACRAGGL